MSNPNPRILVVEADRQLSTELQRYLVSRAGWIVDSANSVESARKQFQQHAYSVVIAGIALPDGSGRDILNLAAEQADDSKSILLAGPMEAQLLNSQGGVQGVQVLLKPFRLKEITSLIAGYVGQKIVSRRCPVSVQCIDGQPSLVSASNSRSEPLTKKERAFVDVLLEAPGVAVSREDIFRRVYRAEMSHGDRSVDVYIGKLRKKMLNVSEGMFTVEHLRGRGYVVSMLSAAA